MYAPTEIRRPLRALAAATLASLSLLLTGCFITPGKFVSELELGPDRGFTFSYEGEIFFLGLSQLAKMGEATKEFEPEPCYIDGTFEERQCTSNELEGQRAAWEANAEKRAAEAAQQAEQMSALLGGIDADDPEATAKFVKLIERQKGWDRVVDKGNGVFDVSYRLEGKLTHEFLFPLIEDVPTTNPFVQIFLRDGNLVRVNAPGFSQQNDDNPLGAMMGGLAGMAGLAALSPESSEAGNETMPDVPAPEGTFTIVTTGGMAIRANNTDEGASATGTGEKLTWEIGPRSKAAPTALIDLGQ
ncbi:MAG: hypothetical protein QNI87_01340 [Erythrobacter sp.]|uniref:hypothetical protein n=1 Tax=Erythrobacter sp. TaxID=1042 RepID=UPI00261E7D56|nr:hypothetical protein [Erythrobacter sp.]MDJ0977159.1 hypothetical protein [Erythrobacter sp.]